MLDGDLGARRVVVVQKLLQEQGLEVAPHATGDTPVALPHVREVVHARERRGPEQRVQRQLRLLLLRSGARVREGLDDVEEEEDIQHRHEAHVLVRPEDCATRPPSARSRA